VQLVVDRRESVTAMPASRSLLNWVKDSERIPADPTWEGGMPVRAWCSFLVKRQTAKQASPVVGSRTLRGGERAN
jgi:hypothetical protein